MVTSQTFQLSSVMALNKKQFPLFQRVVVPVGVSGFAPGAFCHHGTTAQRLKRWIVGRWVELSQGAGILGESEGFLCFFLGGVEHPTKIHQETTRDKQKLRNNNRFFESWVDESMEISDGKCPGWKKLWQFKSAGLFNACVFLFCWTKEKRPDDILSTKIHQKKQLEPETWGASACWGFSEGSTLFFSRNQFMHCFNMEYHNASWGSVLNRELVSKDGLSFLLCMCFTYFLAVGRQVKIFGEVSTTRSIIVMF